ncbi:MAG: gamma-glutamyltransferase [Burkholderiales bacterium]|nr:gamma-glutamyltransferase [Burkholderiales bacterium]
MTTPPSASPAARTMRLQRAARTPALAAATIAAAWFAAAPLALAQPLGVGQFPIGSRFQEKDTAVGQRHMVSAAHPLAVAAGSAMLDRGGSAVDAAIAVQLVLGLVEPHSSGIGGGAFLMHFEAKSGAVEAYDGRETAPAAVATDLFMEAGQKPMQFRRALVGGLAVGVPGVLRMAEMAHKKHGRLPWGDLFTPAIRLADKGYPISPQLSRWLAVDQALKNDPEARALYFNEDGSPKPIGTLIRNPRYANLLRGIARHGADHFYTGDSAVDIAAEVRAHGTNPGHLSVADLRDYRAKLRQPLCFPYRAYEICSMPPPSSGGIALAQMLGMLDAAGFAAAPPFSAEAVHLFSEAAKLAFADRNRYVADSDFVIVPPGLTDPAYLRERARAIGAASSGLARAGVPPGVQLSRADDRSPELPSTSHLSIVDARGNAVAMTTTIETIFGSQLMVNGFILNNQLTDFSFLAEHEGKPVANRVEAGKRPRSSMSPVLVFERGADGKRGPLVLVAGSPGGSVIISFVAKVLVASLDWKMPIKQVLELPNFGSRNLGSAGTLEVERGRFPADLTRELRAKGHDVVELAIESGVHAISRVCDSPAPTRQGAGNGSCRWHGAADPRRDGTAAGR